MKILILANYDVGLFQFRKELIERLLNENQVVIALPYGELIEPLKKMGCSYVNVSVDRRGKNPLTDISLLLNYFRLIRNLRPDLVITYTIKPNTYGGIVARLLKVNYVINITGLGTAFQKESCLKKMVVKMYKLACKDAKTVFFENSANRDIFVNNSIISKNQACLLNGAGVNLTKYAIMDYPQEKTTRFLFMGRVMKEKGIDELFSAMEMLKKENYNVELDILGGYEENYEEKIRRYTKDGWLKYHGYQKEVRPFINKSHCFVLPSWHEGMANANLECAASGRPIITSNIPGCKEAVIDGVSGYLADVKNVNSLYNVMKKFLHLSHKEKIEMGMAGRKHMEDFFDKELVVDKTIEHMM
ncbi:glycosyltransferase family 4 protein [Clostridium sp.]|uniref:glycosyltransferase family 4 protein n=1 Tax=Clostridium sp. TaxID=1506 RepID=UPI002908020B|nr:glycosyltransferase family 4 protein [Clostridium sp.]MDU3411315.1 glycosyltransferase family 4 protein [Clostridium sp.]